MIQNPWRFLAAGIACIATLHFSDSARGQTVSVGSASGQPGWVVPVDVSFTAGPNAVAALSLGVSFDSEAAITKDTDGRPACTVNPATGKLGYFYFRPDLCEGDGCTSVKGVVIATNNTDPIPSGILYTCDIQIALGASPGASHALVAYEMEASDALGSAVTATGTDGAVAVNGGCAIALPGPGGVAHVPIAVGLLLFAVSRRRKLTHHDGARK